MKNKKALIVFGCVGCTIFLMLILCIGGLVLIATQYEQEENKDNDPVIEEIDEDYESPSMGNVNIDIPSIQVSSINNSNINSPDPKQVQINEILLVRDTINLLKNTNWSGSKDAKLPIKVSDYDQSRLENYIENQEAKSGLLTIPNQIEDVFSSGQSATEITSLMMLARNEYIAYLEAKGVNSKYIEEIKSNVLPEDRNRIKYHPENDPNADFSSVGGYNIDENGERDYSKVNLQLYAVDIYNIASNVYNSKILGEPKGEYDTQYWEECRNIAVRQLMYHEMTHVLQRAFVNMNVDEEHRTDKSAYVYADKTLVDVDDKYFWNWGNTEIIAMSNNRQVSQESQADGIAFEILTNVYDMSEEQKEALWAHFFGRLSNSRQALNEIKEISESEWPNLSVDEIGGLLKDVMRDYNQPGESTLIRLTNRVIGFPAYVGYLNPVEPEDTDLFWDYLKN